jgi:hypothetical protein
MTGKKKFLLFMCIFTAFVLYYTLPIAQFVVPPSWMRHQQISDSLTNGEVTASWKLAPGSSGPAITIDVDQGDSYYGMKINQNAHSNIGSEAAIYGYLTTELQILKITSDASDSLPKTYSGYKTMVYIVFDSTKAWQTVQFDPSSSLNAQAVRYVNQWKSQNNVSNSGVLPIFLNGDDCYYSAGAGADSVYFDHLSGNDPYYKDAGFVTKWPATGDTLYPVSSGSIYLTLGEQGEGIWINNNNGGRAATNNSAAITIVNNNSYGEPGLTIAGGPGTSVDQGRIVGDANGKFGYTHIWLSDPIPTKYPPSTQDVDMAGNYLGIYSIYAEGGKFKFGSASNDSLLAWGNALFQHDVKVNGEFIIPNGATLPTSPQTGSVYYKTDTLWIFNGTAWKKFAPVGTYTP